MTDYGRKSIGELFNSYNGELSGVELLYDGLPRAYYPIGDYLVHLFYVKYKYFCVSPENVLRIFISSEDAPFENVK